MTHFKSLFNLILLASIFIFFAACEGDSLNPPEDNILQDSEVAELLEADLQNNFGGISSNLEDLIAYLLQLGLSGELCDTLFTETVSETWQGSGTQSAYNSEFKFELACNRFNFPESATTSTITAFTFSSPRIESDNNSSFTCTISGLELRSDTVIVNGDFTRNGDQEINFFIPRSITSTLTTNLQNLEIKKSDFEILSGRMSFDLTGTTRNNGSFDFSGSIEFLGRQTGTLTLNGSNYPLDWNM